MGRLDSEPEHHPLQPRYSGALALLQAHALSFKQHVRKRLEKGQVAALKRKKSVLMQNKIKFLDPLLLLMLLLMMTMIVLLMLVLMLLLIACCFGVCCLLLGIC